MQSLEPDQATFLLQTILPSLKNEHRLTKKVIEAIPLDKSDFRPDTICKSALDLAWHIVATELLFMDAPVAGGFDFSSTGKPESIQDSAALVAWYSRAFHERFEKVVHLTPEQLMTILDFRGMFQLPAVTYLQFAINHSVHHRGQLSMYLRPMGAKVPSIYGESYDDSQARKAGA